MARYRITFFIDSFQKPGWSESIHTTYTSQTAIANLITSYTLVRQPVLNENCAISDIRVSDDTLYRDILLYPTGLPVTGSGPGSPSPLATTAVLRMRSGNLFFRSMFVRGCSTSLFHGNKFNLASSSWGPLNAFANFLKSTGVGISHQSSPSDALLVQAYNTGTGLFTVDPSIGSLAIDTPMTITRVPRSLVPSRHWRVASSPAPGQFKLQQWPLGVDVSGFGKIRVATPTVTSVDDVIVSHVGERRVGRPFGLPRGRAPVVR